MSKKREAVHGEVGAACMRAVPERGGVRRVLRGLCY